MTLFAAASCAVPRGCAGGIFSDTARPGSVAAPMAPTVRRQRRVEIDTGRLVTAERLTLNLFPDVCVTAVRDRLTDLGGGQHQWEGRVPGAAPGTVTLIVDAGVMVGTIRIDRDVYEIRYLGEGVHAVNDVDPSKFPRD